MPKVTLDRETFKALASDTRLDILRVLDGKNMSLNDICKATNLNKATLHEHLTKLNEVGLIKKNEREGHKWVYYRLTWKGEGLLHPENSRIVVMFTITFIALWVGIINFIWYIKGSMADLSDKGKEIAYGANGPLLGSNDNISVNKLGEVSRSLGSSNTGLSTDFLYIAIACFVIFAIVLCIGVWRLRKNRSPKI